VGVIVTLTVGLVWWLVAWAFGVKAVDAFMLTVGIVVVAAAARLAAPYVERLLGQGPSPEERGL
jgi:hypothetical protein